MEFKGRQAKMFYVWVSLWRHLREPIAAVHENVPKFGSLELIAHLGDLYFVARVLIEPVEL
eukprot:91916-Alexandrium_andersonii.AAC.1